VEQINKMNVIILVETYKIYPIRRIKVHQARVTRINLSRPQQLADLLQLVFLLHPSQ
jgi:ribosomal protein S3AE